MTPVSVAIWKSAGLHLALGGMFFISLDFHKPVIAPDLPAVVPIEAVVVDAREVEEIFEKIEQEKREVEQEKVRQRQEQQRKAQQAEEARKKKAAKARAEKERKRKEAEKKKKQKEERERKEKERKEKERKEKERKEKERKEKERKEKEKKEQERQERLAQERMMREQLEAERAAAQASRRNKQILTEVQKYTGLIKSKIIQNWIIDDTMRGKSCRLNIQLASNGLILKVDELGGDPTVCRTSRAAVLKAETLPVSKDPEVFKEFRNFNLTMSPEVK